MSEYNQGQTGQFSQPPYQAPSVEPPKGRFKSLKSGLSTLALFLLAPLIAIFITSFCFQSYQVDGASMETTLQNNDRLIVNKVGVSWSKITKHPYIPNRGDIIIFEQLGLYDAAGNEERQLIKRVIGLPGERVVIKDGTVKVYNRQFPEGFNPDTAGGYEIQVGRTEGSVDLEVGENQVYVLGDNRSNSADSRVIGPVNASQIVGRLSMRILPISNSKRF